MDFFNKAKESISHAGKELGQRAGDLSAMTKLNLKIREKEKQLQDYYRRLGDLLYDEYPDEALRLYPDLTKLIGGLKVDLECDRHELASFRGNQICPSCGTEQAPNSHFCTACGVNLGGQELDAPQGEETKANEE